ncbi:MAG: hypothetical protein WDM90_17075 [Ferruginibacter sp.]
MLILEKLKHENNAANGFTNGVKNIWSILFSSVMVKKLQAR